MTDGPTPPTSHERANRERAGVAGRTSVLARAEELLRRAATVVETSPGTPKFAAELTAATAELAALPRANTEADVERVGNAIQKAWDDHILLPPIDLTPDERGILAAARAALATPSR